MSLSHRYRNFGGGKPPSARNAENNSEALEDQKLQAFEAGYQAGWDDATKARSDEKEKVSAELGQNLLDMSFTYHEALSKLTVSLEPAMRQIIDKLLPELARAALCAHIMEQLQGMIKERLDGPVEIVVHTKNVQTVLELAGKKISEPFEVVGEDSLGEGQAFVRIANAEKQIDIDAVISDVSKALNAFFHEAGQEKQDG